MAHIILKDADVNIDSNDLSAHVRSVTINYEAEQQDDTNMGDTTRVNLPGLLNWSIDVEFSQDFSAVDAVLFPLVGAAAFTVTIKPASGSVSSSNPSYSGSAVLATYPPLGNAVGDQATAAATFQSAGPLARAIA